MIEVLTQRSMTTADLEKLIEQLGALRATRQPPVTDDYGYGKTVAPVLDPKYWTQPDMLGTAIALRHPGFGWLWFLLPPNERDALIRIWSTQREIGNDQPPPNKLN